MSKVHTYSKHGVWRVCKGRRCAWCVPSEDTYLWKMLCGKTVGLGRNGVGRCLRPKGHGGKHLTVGAL